VFLVFSYDLIANCDDTEGSSPSGASIAPQTCIRSIREDRNHDAVMRIGGETPRRRAYSKPRLNGHSPLYRVAATSDRGLQFGINRRPTCSNSYQSCLPAGNRSGWTKEETCRRLACHGLGQPRCPSDAIDDPRRPGSSLGARGHCRLWQVLARVAFGRPRLAYRASRSRRLRENTSCTSISAVSVPTPTTRVTASQEGGLVGQRPGKRHTGNATARDAAAD
jgi:hypothetical protein